jgi:two-component system, NarL family, invasion response regulator UvrY
MLKILIADDHPVVRRGLRQIIEGTADMVVAAEAADGREALLKARTGDYDVVLLDITMPSRNGVDVLSHLKKDRPTLPILMLSMHPEEQYAVRALRAGASGYLTKESAPEELVAAIRKVSTGRKYVSASLAESLASMVQDEGEPLAHETLSQREFQVMCLIASGKTVSEVARELVLSVKTVSTYRARILVKMRLRNTAELIRYATTNQLVE